MRRELRSKQKVGIRAISFFVLFGLLGFFLGWPYGRANWKSERSISKVTGKADVVLEAPSTADSSRSAVEVLSLRALNEAIGNGYEWRRNVRRNELIQATFESHAKASGVVAAIRDAFRIFDVPTLPVILKEIEVEIAIVSCLSLGRVSDADLASLVSESPPWASGPLLRGFALVSDFQKAPDIYGHLRNVLDLSKRKGDRKLGMSVFAFAVEAAHTCDERDLSSLAKMIPRSPDTEHIEAMIAAASSGRDGQLPVQFIVRQSNRDPWKLARYVRDLNLSSDQLVVLCTQLAPGERSDFVTRYIGQLGRANPQLYVELAQAVDANELPANVRSQLIGGLLKSGAGDALEWLKTLPEQEKAAALSAAYEVMVKQGGWDNTSSKAWLAAASTCKGVGEKQFVAAIRSVSSFLDWETLSSYASLLPQKVRSGIERDLYSSQVSQLAKTDPKAAQSFVNSAPKALRSQLLWNAANTLANSFPESIMDWYNETSDPTTKRTLEEAMMSAENLTGVPLEIRRGWIMERTKMPLYLKQPSLAVNRYLLDLMAIDGSAAVSFARTLPDSPARDSALGELARQWAHRDPLSASQWIVELPAGKGRDIAISELTKASRDDPERAFLNLAAISDSKMRGETANSVVEWWKSRDPQKVDDLIHKSTLSSEEKAELLRLLRK